LISPIIARMSNVPIRGSGPKGGTGKADIVYENYIWEVKPDKKRWEREGPVQLDRYVNNMPGAEHGFSLPTFEVPYGNKVLVVRSGNGKEQQGMLCYSEQPRQRATEEPSTNAVPWQILIPGRNALPGGTPVTQPASPLFIFPTDVWQKFKELLTPVGG